MGYAEAMLLEYNGKKKTANRLSLNQLHRRIESAFTGRDDTVDGPATAPLFSDVMDEESDHWSDGVAEVLPKI